jgi:predicted AAA+ superfamily ATPase
MKYYPRIIEKTLLEYLNRPEAIFILGARQVGKTSLMKHIMAEIDNNRYLYIDLENSINLSIFTKGVNEFLNYLKYQKLSKSELNYIFIDEIQYAPDFSSLIKYIVDHYSDRYKLILSGSSSLQIRNKFKESLVGRKIVFELYPLNFTEFCLFRNESKIADILQQHNPLKLNEDHLRFEKDKTLHLLKEYLVYGGFPKVVLQENKTSKVRILQDIVQSYVMKDIRYLFHLEKISQFNHLIKLLAVFIGKEINISQLATETKLHKQTLKHYISALESSYIIKMIQPFHKNLSSELRKTPKCYFIDNGLRNFLISNFNEAEFRPDRGELLENFIFTQLLIKSDPLTKINYWRTKSKQEIDFILQKENQLFALEVKWSDGSFQNLRKFVQIYPDSSTFMISMLRNFEKEKNYLPVYWI